MAMTSLAGVTAGRRALATPERATPPALGDVDMLNFMLNLEYLQAEFYLRAAHGHGLEAEDISGRGRPGGVVGGRKLAWADAAVHNYAVEIAAEEVAHVRLLRAMLGGARIARPLIDINDAFTRAARRSGIIGDDDVFDPFDGESRFLLGAYLLEDLAVTAYKGVAMQFKSLQAAHAVAGLLATEAYHAGGVRVMLYARGVYGPTARIAAARNELAGGSAMDQGVGDFQQATIVPADGNGVLRGRTPEQLLAIVYLNSGRRPGGFFPRGLNGVVR